MIFLGNKYGACGTDYYRLTFCEWARLLLKDEGAMATLTVIYDPQDRVAFKPPPGNPKAFDDIKFASMRVGSMDNTDVALVTQDLTKALVAQLQKGD